MVRNRRGFRLGEPASGPEGLGVSSKVGSHVPRVEWKGRAVRRQSGVRRARVGPVMSAWAIE